MKATGSITLSKISDGFTTFYQYAKGTSNTTAPTTGWSASMPAHEAGKFIWRREASALTLSAVSSWINATCLTGATGIQGIPGIDYTGIEITTSSHEIFYTSWNASNRDYHCRCNFAWEHHRFRYLNTGTIIEHQGRYYFDPQGIPYSDGGIVIIRAIGNFRKRADSHTQKEEKPAAQYLEND